MSYKSSDVIDFIIYILNPTLLFYQVYIAWNSIESFSLALFSYFVILQARIFFDKKNRNNPVMRWAMGFSALGSITIVLRILYVKYG